MRAESTSLPLANTHEACLASKQSLLLTKVRLEKLVAHPGNSNVMDREGLEKLRRNIAREQDYPPLIVRPLTDGDYQILDGHQRAAVLKEMEYSEVLCYVWPCDDATALILLATLNRLEGADDPLKRAQLISSLLDSFPVNELGQLIPESKTLIEDTLTMLNLDMEQLEADLKAAGRTSSGLGEISFAVTKDQEELIEQAIALASSGLEGPVKRGRALASVCEFYLERNELHG